MEQYAYRNIKKKDENPLCCFASPYDQEGLLLDLTAGWDFDRCAEVDSELY